MSHPSLQALINSTVTANMNFTKTSPKFGQWSDYRANTVYGLGFSSEKDLLQVYRSSVSHLYTLLSMDILYTVCGKIF